MTRNGSTAEQVAEAYFPDVPYHLEHKCDGCLYNEYCMKWSAEEDDLSLLPYLTVGDKSALHAAGIRTTRDLATLKEPVPGEKERLLPAPGRTQQVRRISATRGVGARLDELVHRARLFRRSQRDDIEALTYIPSKGYGTLPYSAPGHNANLVRVYLDAQHDYLNDRIYMLGALVVACEDGAPVRRRSIVRLADGPPETNERERDLFESWINETVSAIVGSPPRTKTANGARRSTSSSTIRLSSAACWRGSGGTWTPSSAPRRSTTSSPSSPRSTHPSPPSSTRRSAS